MRDLVGFLSKSAWLSVLLAGVFFEIGRIFSVHKSTLIEHSAIPAVQAFACKRDHFGYGWGGRMVPLNRHRPGLEFQRRLGETPQWGVARMTFLE